MVNKMQVSIIVPIYNEENRFNVFLQELIDFSIKNSYEVILVDDGSTDNTPEIIKNYESTKNNIKVISHPKNIGKGFAIKTGVFYAEGEKIIFIDADGSISPSEIPKMVEKLDEYDVVVGNRTLKESNIEQPYLRKLTGVTFNHYVNLLFHLNIKDNLCGFKGFRKEVAKDLFSLLISHKFIFDVELFYKIRKKNYSLYPLPITWVHKGESKIKLFDPIKMAFRLLRLKRKLR